MDEESLPTIQSTLFWMVVGAVAVVVLQRLFHC